VTNPMLLFFVYIIASGLVLGDVITTIFPEPSFLALSFGFVVGLFNGAFAIWFAGVDRLFRE